MPESKRKTVREHSAGGAVLRMHDGIVEVAMIATKKKTRWGLPKGAVSQGETEEQAAVREVEEETGLRAEIVGPPETIEYFFRGGSALIQKRVDFYLMRFLGGDIRPQLEEVDDAAWIPLPEAIQKAAFDSERKLLGKILEAWEAMPEEERKRYEGS
ncbi:MAG TPA: NUDIX hydrolase [Thermoanaerobaculia bacterium]